MSAMSSKFDVSLDHNRGLINKALLAVGAVLGALVLSWVVYLVMVAAVILWG